jgi:hypothetical protein
MTTAPPLRAAHLKDDGRPDAADDQRLENGRTPVLHHRTVARTAPTLRTWILRLLLFVAEEAVMTPRRIVMITIAVTRYHHSCPGREFDPYPKLVTKGRLGTQHNAINIRRSNIKIIVIKERRSLVAVENAKRNATASAPLWMLMTSRLGTQTEPLDCLSREPR